jgi:hypothetical protein
MTAVSGWLLSWPTSWHNAFHGREQIPNFGKSSSSIATCNERTSDYRVYQPFEDATDARRGFPGVYHSLTFSNMSFFLFRLLRPERSACRHRCFIPYLTVCRQVRRVVQGGQGKMGCDGNTLWCSIYLMPGGFFFLFLTLVLFLRCVRKEDMDDTTAADSMHT